MEGGAGGGGGRERERERSIVLKNLINPIKKLEGKKTQERKKHVSIEI